ncbi:uncharacterized protein EV420DRAFT_1483495 [Desarmillaria tabescens]|uniref:Uncharacterized protein n=1 Tax=Armillaria tabescens TaxID=1929756 RepID=A0AA39JUQ4_ARMTA|nr:uncharacterized protein EV420DRAFT_1483495 [Desarmillaria tabescens]KAK0448245.1 hypothetical protein EV420DRAFT_1483495 [Desarmillaria tabescens]
MIPMIMWFTICSINPAFTTSRCVLPMITCMRHNVTTSCKLSFFHNASNPVHWKARQSMLPFGIEEIIFRRTTASEDPETLNVDPDLHPVLHDLDLSSDDDTELESMEGEPLDNCLKGLNLNTKSFQRSINLQMVKDTNAACDKKPETPPGVIEKERQGRRPMAFKLFRWKRTVLTQPPSRHLALDGRVSDFVLGLDQLPKLNSIIELWVQSSEISTAYYLIQFASNPRGFSIRLAV